MRISIIAAIGENRELGKNNKLLWNIPGELKRFKEITMGSPMIMGRKTHESIGRILSGRTNIIISRDANYKVEGAVIVHSFDEAIDVAKTVIASETKQSPQDPSTSLRMTKEKEIFIIGGAQIFEQALSITDRLYLTIVHKTFDADVYFPEYPQFTKVVERQDMQRPEFAYTFLTLEK